MCIYHFWFQQFMRHFVQSLHWQHMITDHQPLISLLFSASLQQLRWLFFESPRSALLPLGNTLWYCPLHWQTPKRPVRLDEAPKKLTTQQVWKKMLFRRQHTRNIFIHKFSFFSACTPASSCSRRGFEAQPQHSSLNNQNLQHLCNIFSLAPCKFARGGDFTGDQFRFHKMERKDHHTLLIHTYIDPLKGG